MTGCAVLLPPNGVLVYVVDSKISLDNIITGNSEVFSCCKVSSYNVGAKYGAIPHQTNPNQNFVCTLLTLNIVLRRVPSTVASIANDIFGVHFIIHAKNCFIRCYYVIQQLWILCIHVEKPLTKSQSLSWISGA